MPVTTLIGGSNSPTANSSGANAIRQVSGANAAEYSVMQGGVSYNPGFDSRLLTRNAQHAGGFNRSPASGFMRTRELVGTKRYGLRFLFHPSEVGLSHSIVQDMPVVQNMDPSIRNQGLRPLADMQSGASWTLLFDRTYELWDSAYKGSFVGTYGAWVDIKAFYDMVGVTRRFTTTKTSEGVWESSFGDTTTDWHPVGPMVPNPVDVEFGGPLKFYGFVSSGNIQILQWSASGVPMRATLAINLTLSPDIGMEARNVNAQESTTKTGTEGTAEGGFLNSVAEWAIETDPTGLLGRLAD
jgi:hypothetical protein